MGEAKRRKQALGDRYGEMPPILMDGSVQLSEHVEKFAAAYFEELKKCPSELLTTYFQHTEESLNQKQSEPNDKAYQKLENWLMRYFEPYRQADREKLSLGLLLPLYASLYLNDKKRGPDEEENNQHFLMDLTMCLFSFNCLKPFLSESNQERYGGILYRIYSEMKTEIEADKRFYPESETPEMESLAKLFHPILDIEASPA